MFMTKKVHSSLEKTKKRWGGMGKLWSSHIMKYYTEVKMNQLENLHVSDWLKLRIKLNEKSRFQNNIYSIIPFILSL